jgi:hypothetical protein
MHCVVPEIDFPKVRMFLESVARGSKNSKCSYEIGLNLQCFLGSSHCNNNSNSGGDNDNDNDTNNKHQCHLLVAEQASALLHRRHDVY